MMKPLAPVLRSLFISIVDISCPDTRVLVSSILVVECGSFLQEGIEEAVKMTLSSSFKLVSLSGGVRKSCFKARSLPEVDCAALRYDKRTYVLSSDSKEDPSLTVRIQILSLTVDQKREINDRLFMLRKNISADIMAFANEWFKEDHLKTSSIKSR